MKKLIRKGECNHCGLCCGFGTRTPCDHFDPVTHLCMVHRIAQPPYCRTFPRHPKSIPQAWSACTFRFYDSETGEEVTKKKRKNTEGNWECDWNELDSYPDIDEDC